ncbi:MAG: hypothetical protein ACRCVV_22005 [Shewanella sp.]
MNTLTLKIIAVLICVIGSIAYLSHCLDVQYTKGYNTAIGEFAQKALVQLQEKDALREKTAKELMEVNRLLEEEKAKRKVVTKEITRDVIQYVKVPDRTVCEFDSEWLRIRESVLNIADPRSVSTH